MNRELVFLHGSEVPRCRARIDKRFIGYSSLQFCVSGAVELCYNSRRYELPAGWVWPTNPGPRIRFHPIGEYWHHCHIAVTGPQLDAWRQEGLWPEAPLPAPAPESLHRAWQELLPFSRDAGYWQQRRAHNRLESMLLALLPEYAADTPEPPWISEAKEALRLGEQQESIAEKLGWAMSTFRRRFTETVGSCPQDWQQQDRIDRVCEALLHTERTIGALAEEFGFHDQAHFSRRFRARMGMSPSAYRTSRLDI